MRLFVKLMVLVLVAALAGPFFIRGPDGRPLMTINDVATSFAESKAGLQRRWQQLTAGIARSTGNENAGKTRIYRWQDADGQWHFADEPPPDRPSEALYVDPNVNLLGPPPPGTAQPSTDPGADPAITLPLIVNPGAVTDIVDDARSARDLVNERNEEVRKRIEQNP